MDAGTFRVLALALTTSATTYGLAAMASSAALAESTANRGNDSAVDKLYDVVVVGAGLSGVYLAQRLHKQQTPALDFALVEATDRPGGRLSNDEGGNGIDLGAAWIWPDHQPKMRRLVTQELGIPTMQQRPVDPYTRTERIHGGAYRIVEELVGDLPEDRVLYDTPVRKCVLQEDRTVRLECDGSNASGNDRDTVLRAKSVVFAVPPRLLHKHVSFDPPLSANKQRALAGSNTWMAGVTKVALVYPSGFWLDSPRGMQACSRIGAVPGPVFQMYDATTAAYDRDGSGRGADSVRYALTAFTLATDAADETELVGRVVRQLDRLWRLTGNQDLADRVESYTDAFVKSWPQHEYVSENAEPATIQPHPHPVSSLAEAEWDGRLFFAGTETDQSSPGVMEGAIGASQRVLRQLVKHRTTAVAEREQKPTATPEL